MSTRSLGRHKIAPPSTFKTIIVESTIHYFNVKGCIKTNNRSIQVESLNIP